MVLPVFKTGGPDICRDGGFDSRFLPPCPPLIFLHGKLKLMNIEKERIRAHLFISGGVQGVFYRANTKNVALEHHLTGWVRNCYDGRVEAVLEGGRINVEKVIKWCKEGPPSANVTDLEIITEEATGEFSSFSIRY